MEPLCHLMGINFRKLSKEEYLLLEADIFIRICEGLREFFGEQHKGYFHLMKFNLEKENTMLENNLVRLITNDVLSTKEYNLNGIAHYSLTLRRISLSIVIANPAFFCRVWQSSQHFSGSPRLAKNARLAMTKPSFHVFLRKTA